jgi:predicted amidohydrolase YtcJ
VNENPHEWTTLNDSGAAFKSIPFLQQKLEAAFTTVRDLGAGHKLIGTIEVGKWADIVAVSGNPLQDIPLLKSVDFVMKEGKVYD